MIRDLWHVSSARALLAEMIAAGEVKDPAKVGHTHRLLWGALAFLSACHDAGLPLGFGVGKVKQQCMHADLLLEPGQWVFYSDCVGGGVSLYAYDNRLSYIGNFTEVQAGRFLDCLVTPEEIEPYL